VKRSASPRPVLKHGPRSLPARRVLRSGCRPSGRSEGKLLWQRPSRPSGPGASQGSPAPEPSGWDPKDGDLCPVSLDPLSKALTRAALRTWPLTPFSLSHLSSAHRPGRSHWKQWWRLVAILTCKSFVGVGDRGERLLEPSSSWFLPKFPSGECFSIHWSLLASPLCDPLTLCSPFL